MLFQRYSVVRSATQELEVQHNVSARDPPMYSNGLSDLTVNAKLDMGGVTWRLFLSWICTNYKSSRNTVAGLFICLELLFVLFRYLI